MRIIVAAMAGFAVLAGTGVQAAPPVAADKSAALERGTAPPIKFSIECFIAVGGTAAFYKVNCDKHAKLTEAEAAARYVALSAVSQVSADVAAEEMSLKPTASARQ